MILRDAVGLCVLSQLVRETWWSPLITMYTVVISGIALFHCMSACRRYDRTPHSRCVPLLCHDDGAFCTVQAVLQTATNRCTV